MSTRVVERPSEPSLTPGGRCRLRISGLALTAGVLALATAPRPAPANEPAGEPPVALRELAEPLELCPDEAGVLDATLEVRFAEVWVDTADSDSGLGRRRMALRTYHLGPGTRARPCDGRDWKPTGEPLIPGPTFRIRKSDRGTTNGTRLRLRLVNALPPGQPPWVCNPARNFRPPYRVPPVDGQCLKEAFPLLDPPWPACFHGDNVTNVHFHGFHVSPQPPQDDVLLTVGPGDSFQYELDPLPYTQTEGTHWYHPHKHGSTALQVLNGMAGTVIIEGPFDDWLDRFFQDQGHPLEDRVLVIQQIDEGIEHFKRFDPLVYAKVAEDGTPVKENGELVPCGDSDPPETCGCTPGSTYDPPTPAVDGHIDPVITMQPGEVQRWRLVGATMQASAHLRVRFPHELQVYQIAQDGVRFAEATYRDQPLLDPTAPASGEPDQITELLIAPGNRVDLLVRAPLEVPAGGLLPIAYHVVGHMLAEVKGRVGARNAKVKEKLRAAAEAIHSAVDAGGLDGDPALFTVRLAGPPKPMRLPHRDERGEWREGGRYAREWPPLPDYLKPLGPPDRLRDVEFSMAGTSPGTADNRFYINDVQYCPDCANVTMTLGTTEEWHITNVSTPNHPFHIHVNPFQLRKIFGLYDPKPGTETIPVYAEYDPPIWQDTIALPGPGCVPVPTTGGDCAAVCEGWGGRLAGSEDDCDPPAAGSCGCYADEGHVEIRQRLRDFTGEYVIHCHILGHEDRGMMLNVQTVCPEPHGTSFGQPEPGRPECREGDPLTAAAARCPASYATGPRCAEAPASSALDPPQSRITPTASPRRSPRRE